MVMGIKVGSIVCHWKRSLALSAPRNISNWVVKYLAIPIGYGEWQDRKKWEDLMNNCEDLKNRELNEKYEEILKGVNEKK